MTAWRSASSRASCWSTLLPMRPEPREELENRVEDIVKGGGTSTTSKKNTSIFYFSYMKLKAQIILAH